MSFLLKRARRARAAFPADPSDEGRRQGGQRADGVDSLRKRCSQNTDSKGDFNSETLDVDAVAKSLEAAAAQVKQLTKLTEAQDVHWVTKESSEAIWVGFDELANQMKALQGAIAKQHTGPNKALVSIADAVEARRYDPAGMAANSEKMLRGIQAQTHQQFARNIRRDLRLHDVQPSRSEKAALVTIAKDYGWETGNKATRRDRWSLTTDEILTRLETDNEQIERRWKDALSCLEIVTLPSLTHGAASYDTFVK